MTQRCPQTPADAPMVLHHCVSARSFRPLWLLEELGQDFELRMWPFPPRQWAREYLNINPLGTVPLFEHGALQMTESAAICQYLAARYSPGQLDVGPGEAAHGEYLNWLHRSDATFTYAQTLVLRYRHFEVPERRQPQVADDYERWFLARLRSVDTALAHDEYLCAGRFTAADVAVGYALQLATHLGLEAAFSGPVQRYWTRLRSRPAFQRALQRQDDAAREQGVPTVPAPDVRPPTP